MNDSPTRGHYGLALQVQVLCVCLAVRDGVSRRIERLNDDDSGEVTATTALIVLLVIAAIGAGTVIAGKITSNANRIPDPG